MLHRDDLVQKMTMETLGSTWRFELRLNRRAGNDARSESFER